MSNVVPLGAHKPDYLTPVKALQSIIEQLQSGELDPNSLGVLVLRDPQGVVTVYAMGAGSSAIPALGLLSLGQQRLGQLLLP